MSDIAFNPDVLLREANSHVEMFRNRAYVQAQAIADLQQQLALEKAKVETLEAQLKAKDQPSTDGERPAEAGETPAAAAPEAPAAQSEGDSV